ncbi:MAG: hypothetical protein HUJ68_04545 [Clostridia bacterium]|nr:hypothetical protein [Clostridia bacterium]
MAKLDDIVEKINGLKSKAFDWNRDLDNVVSELGDLYFNAEIDHGNYYLTMLEQYWKMNLPREQILTGENLRNLTEEEKKWFYKYGNFKDDVPFKIAVSLHWFINVKEHYVKVLINRGIVTKFTTPKEDYGKMYTATIGLETKRPYEVIEFKLNRLNDSFANIRDTLNKLIEAFEYSRAHYIGDDFNSVVKYDMIKYWGNEELADHTPILDPEFQETGRPEIIKIPHPHKKVSVAEEKDFLRIINGAGFNEIKWPTSDDVQEKYHFDESHEPMEFKTSITGRKTYVDTNSVTYSFSNKRDADNFFYSAIEFVNNYGVKPTIHTDQKPVKIDKLEKRYYSNRWPMAKTAEESEELEKTLTHYFVSITKFHDTPIFKEEIWEMGIVFEISNKFVYGYFN